MVDLAEQMHTTTLKDGEAAIKAAMLEKLLLRRKRAGKVARKKGWVPAHLNKDWKVSGVASVLRCCGVAVLRCCGGAVGFVHCRPTVHLADSAPGRRGVACGAECEAQRSLAPTRSSVCCCC